MKIVISSKTATCEHTTLGIAERVNVTDVVSSEPRLYIGLIVLLEKSNVPLPEVDHVILL